MSATRDTNDRSIWPVKLKITGEYIRTSVVIKGTTRETHRMLEPANTIEEATRKLLPRGHDHCSEEKTDVPRLVESRTSKTIFVSSKGRWGR